MRQLFKNLAPHRKVVVVLIFLLAIQAYCDLALPQYTQDIIDVGVQNKGIEHILPEKTTAKEYEEAQIFMNKQQKDLWQAAYEKDGDKYVLAENDADKLDRLDEELLTPIVLTYQMGHATVKQFKDTVKSGLEKNPMTKPLASQIGDMSVAEMEQTLHLDIPTFRAKDENGKEKTYIDMRPMMQDMIDSGQMDAKAIAKAKSQMQSTIDKVGSQTLKAMGIAYASDCDKAAGVDVVKIQKKYLWHCGLLMALMAAGMMAVATLVAFLASRTGATVGRTLRHRVFNNVIGFSNAEIDRFSTASLITRATNDVQQIQMVTTVLLRLLLYAPIIGIWGVIKVYRTGANMSWVIVLGVLVILGFVGVLMTLTMPKFRKMQQLVDALNRVTREILTGLSVIRAFGREDKEEERFADANRDLYKAQLFTNRVMTMMMPGMTMLMNGLVVLITWVAANRIDHGTMQVGAMTAFITYAMMIVMSFMMMTMMCIFLPRAGVAANRIQEVCSTASSITDKAETVEPAYEDETKRGAVVFSHVDFRYPDADENVLTDIDFTANPGEMTAIIGSTGSGKSSVVRLIPRFYDVTGGSVTVDGVDVRDRKLASLRADIGMVPQKGVLFSGTIRSNICYGKEDISEEQMEKAARIAQAEDFILEKEDGYDSVIAQGGDNVSGGQKQRLAIARALALEPQVLIFDDSFSALDMKTDTKLRQALADELPNTTRIVVAQRVSSILHADRIIVMDEGRVVGNGKHEDLMKTCEVYRQIAESQLSSHELEAM